ncbi:MAG: hypothetical protein ACOCPZ_03260 [Natrialbaceae archaeon]
MSPQQHDPSPVEKHLHEALEAAENRTMRYHIREALQLTELDQ